jgi:hypothetical protein
LRRQGSRSAERTRLNYAGTVIEPLSARTLPIRVYEKSLALSSVSSQFQSKVEVRSVDPLPPRHPIRVADVQSHQQGKDVTEASSRQRRVDSRRIPKVSKTTLCARPGHGLADWQHWTSSIRNDRSDVVGPQNEDDGGQRAEVLRTQPDWQDEDGIVSVPCPTSSSRSQCFVGLARAIVLCGRLGFPVPLSSVQREQATQSRQHPGEKYSACINEDRSCREAYRLAQFSSLTCGQPEIARC